MAATEPMLERPQPAATLAILLGASEWPDRPDLSRPSFKNSHDRFRRYLADGMKLPDDNVLSLFDSERSPAGVSIAITEFLEARCSGKVSPRPRDLIVYYTGHGEQYDDELHLLIRKSRPEKEATCLRIKTLAKDLYSCARHLRQFVILDACYSGCANGQWWKSPQGVVLLCSAHQTDQSRAPNSDEFTQFSGALLSIVAPEPPVVGSPTPLSAEELMERIEALIHERHPRDGVEPALYAPVQKKGIRKLPAFPILSQPTPPPPAPPPTPAEVNANIDDLLARAEVVIVPTPKPAKPVVASSPSASTTVGDILAGLGGLALLFLIITYGGCAWDYTKGKLRGWLNKDAESLTTRPFSPPIDTNKLFPSLTNFKPSPTTPGSASARLVDAATTPWMYHLSIAGVPEKASRGKAVTIRVSASYSTASMALVMPGRTLPVQLGTVSIEVIGPDGKQAAAWADIPANTAVSRLFTPNELGTYVVNARYDEPLSLTPKKTAQFKFTCVMD